MLENKLNEEIAIYVRELSIYSDLIKEHDMKMKVEHDLNHKNIYVYLSKDAIDPSTQKLNYTTMKDGVWLGIYTDFMDNDATNIFNLFNAYHKEYNKPRTHL